MRAMEPQLVTVTFLNVPTFCSASKRYHVPSPAAAAETGYRWKSKECMRAKSWRLRKLCCRLRTPKGSGHVELTRGAMSATLCVASSSLDPLATVEMQGRSQGSKTPKKCVTYTNKNVPNGNKQNLQY